ncbi:hypothetical protein PO883_12770 [Massilia sp. DJPM01]|uniref:hypothetical protein n=1 Tax=Massilia sp. DJPM01 TaxID=3024404 RepID=UPI00259EB504|nr:hypothetical protein [Massilia sp. DJPM01]MDM5178065.1 hypothetical protein [Massilia sp. DJPM01]
MESLLLLYEAARFRAALNGKGKGASPDMETFPIRAADGIDFALRRQRKYKKL